MVEAENQRNGTAGVNGKCRILADVLVKIIRVAPNGKHRVQMKVSLKKDGDNEEENYALSCCVASQKYPSSL